MAVNMNERASNFATDTVVSMINAGWFKIGDGISDQQSANATVANVITVYNAMYAAIFNTLRG